MTVPSGVQLPGGGNNVNAGNGLIGGGQGNVTLHVNPGVGIIIQNNAVTLNANLEGLNNVGGNNGSAGVGEVLTWNGFQWTALQSTQATALMVRPQHRYFINPGTVLTEVELW